MNEHTDNIPFVSILFFFVLINSRVYTWGWGIHGQLGHGDAESLLVPTPVTSLSTVKEIRSIQIAAGYAHSLVLNQQVTFLNDDSICIQIFNYDICMPLAIAKKKNTVSINTTLELVSCLVTINSITFTLIATEKKH